MSIDLIATTTFGLEAVVKRECQALGFQNIKTSDGKVEFTGDESDIVKANLWLESVKKQVGSEECFLFNSIEFGCS